MEPEFLRYYYACKLSNGIDDIDLNLEDFVARVNSDLIGKLVNIASRCAGFISKRFDGELAPVMAEPELYAEFTAAADEIAESYATLEYGRAIRKVMALADRANQYIDDRKPWVLAKDPDSSSEVQAVCSVGLNLFRALMIYLKPVLPEMAAQAEKMLNAGEFSWSSVNMPLLGIYHQTVPASR